MQPPLFFADPRKYVQCDRTSFGQRHNTGLPSGSARATMPDIAKGKNNHGGRMSQITRHCIAAGVAAFVFAVATANAQAKDRVKVGFIGPLTGGVSVNGLGGRNSADLAVRLRNADSKAKYEYELVVLDDECKPNV